MFALNPPRQAQTRCKTQQALGLTQAGNSHCKLMTEFVPKEFSTFPPTSSQDKNSSLAKTTPI